MFKKPYISICVLLCTLIPITVGDKPYGSTGQLFKVTLRHAVYMVGVYMFYKHLLLRIFFVFVCDNMYLIYQFSKCCILL